ncbi:universal stress protein [Nonomuraea sp. NPDC046570]|uniref:universal stress protein n=1 Tax=Nonomuraea sp. NPDC046570 TaxID=3155255 RepID=UPI0033E7329C
MTALIIVGVDGSAPGTAAVEWAADDAFRMGAELKIVHVLDRWPYNITRFPVPDQEDLLLKGASRVLEAAEATARARQPTVEVSTRLIEGVPAAVLQEQGQGQGVSELVIGNRGLGGFAGAVLGSVTMQVAGQAHCPVVVVRAEPQGRQGEIVVGVDDSDACDPALGYAFEQARLRGAMLRAIYAWQLPVHAFAPEISYDLDEVRAAGREIVTRRLAEWRAKHPEVTLIEDVQNAHPVNALTSAACDLIVVGSHGRSAIGSLFLGSVSRGVLHHARGTVAVVRSQKS